MGSKSIFIFDHNCHSKGDHIDIYLFVPHSVHLQEVIRLGLSVFDLIDVIQFLQENQLQLLYLLIHIFYPSLLLLQILPILAARQTYQRLP